MKRANKFSAKPITLYGKRFASTAEGHHYLVLLDLQRKRAIAALTLQPKFDLVVNGSLVGTYTPDFAYVENRKQIVEETKGFKARDFALRSKLFQALHPHIELRVNGVKIKTKAAA